MKSFVNFLKHNNLVPIALSFVLLGAGSTYAMQNPERLYSAEDRVVSIDNTYLVDKDLETYSPTVRIANVTEDADAYYVAYELSTIALVDSVWQDTTKIQTLMVYKDDLKDERDLGAYVTRQLSHTIARELAQLQKTQTFEKKQISQKQVATTHAGLVGMFMDDKTETIPPYTPPDPKPIPAPAPAPKPNVETGEEKQKEQPENNVQEQTTTENEAESTAGTESTPANHAPEIQLLGDATIYVAIGATYTDLGVHATDKEDKDVPTTVAVNGTLVEKVQLDTATSATYTITYTATDSDGASTSLNRTVVVGEESVENGSKSEPSSGGSGGSGGGGTSSGNEHMDERDATSTPQTPASSTPAQERSSSTESHTETPAGETGTTTESTSADAAEAESEESSHEEGEVEDETHVDDSESDNIESSEQTEEETTNTDTEAASETANE